MTNGGFQFMKEMGIESCTLDDPSPSSLPPPLPTEALIPKLTEKDARWLQNLSVMWEQEPELGFVPPRCLWEYLSGYPNGIREAVGEAVKSLEVSLSDDDLDDLAQDIVAMFLDFAQDLEDIVEMYPLQPPMRPGGCQSEQFREYVTLRVMVGMLAMLHTNPAGMDDFGECLGF